MWDSPLGVMIEWHLPHFLWATISSYTFLLRYNTIFCILYWLFCRCSMIPRFWNIWYDGEELAVQFVVLCAKLLANNVEFDCEGYQLCDSCVDDIIHLTSLLCWEKRCVVTDWFNSWYIADVYWTLSGTFVLLKWFISLLVLVSCAP